MLLKKHSPCKYALTPEKTFAISADHRSDTMELGFLAAENDCGQSLLRVVSRGSTIIAELLRLTNNIPGATEGPRLQDGYHFTSKFARLVHPPHDV
jgi:hypothetical protein